MKKEYIKPECYIVKVGLESMLASSDNEVGGGGELGDGEGFDSRDDYYDKTPSRPGSGNIWDQGW